jgi:predicted glycogen debranching enzyme
MQRQLPVQEPPPGARLLAFAGDTLSFSLALPETAPGQAWLRTTIGHGAASRREIIRHVECGEPPLGRDWFDIPMSPKDSRTYTITLPLWEAGHFQAKAFFLPEGKNLPVWPEGGNTIVNVKPAHTVCANILYNAFIRQFGPNKDGQAVLDPEKARAVEALDQLGWVVIPPSGTFRSFKACLGHVAGTLGCRNIQLLPVHPSPTTYARMGRFGSPYAALNFTAVDAALADFDPRATPLEQFTELLDAVHALGARVLLDIAVNHTGWAAQLHETHPEWLVRDEHGRIEVPGAWGVVWSDLTKLDYRHKGLWVYMAEVFEIWCRRGVDGFRCDAGYMLPVEAWRYIVARVRNKYPDTVFLLEGLGGKISVTREILDAANFDMAYSEIFQNYDRGALEWYLPGVHDIARSDGLPVHFAETHDNNRLAARGKPWAKMRAALCALFSHNGAFGYANGVEWFATEKIDVHQSNSLNWGARENQIRHLRRLALILARHPAFHDKCVVRLVNGGPGNALVLLRHHLPTGKRLLVLVNLDDTKPAQVAWNPRETRIEGPEYHDLVTEKRVDVLAHDGLHTLYLPPAGAFCLTTDPDDLKTVKDDGAPLSAAPDREIRQRMRAKALEILSVFRPDQDISGIDPDALAARLAQDPERFVREMSGKSAPPVTVWRWPQDTRREVMVPPGHFQLFLAPAFFRVRLKRNREVLAGEHGLPLADGGWFLLFRPRPAPQTNTRLSVKIRVFQGERPGVAESPVLFLAKPENARVSRWFTRQDLEGRPLLFLGTNGRGGMARAHARWGELLSKYDALLAANLSPTVPVDRWCMLSRLRAWVVYQGFSQELNAECLESCGHGLDSTAWWRFRVVSGQGQYVSLLVRMGMEQGRNAARIAFYRETAGKSVERLEDAKKVLLILRPDVEDRSFHDNTKAYLGPEHLWPRSVETLPNGFVFAPSPDRRLQVTLSPGTYHSEPEWRYMVRRPLEAERGQDPDSDLFSPGYFAAGLKGGESADLRAEIRGAGEKDTEGTTLTAPLFTESVETAPLPLGEALEKAMSQYVVRRDAAKTVIAGYPWFLDWGRDSLIFLRGLAASGNTRDARLILKQFARFEHKGTLPNMIRGEDARNRDTSDAPLWFFTACGDLMDAEGSLAFLEEDCGGRTLLDVLRSIARGYLAGAPNGVRVDPETGLVYSPSHFTWMDTNYPAATPRQGYPVEIQALWHKALTLLARVDKAGERGRWAALADKVAGRVMGLFYGKDQGYLADCLHAAPGRSAKSAEADFALRPNQLFAVTLGAVTDHRVARGVLAACAELLVPGAVRSLADRPVCRPLPVERDGVLLNNPCRPYQGRYEGDEDTKRKPAYHNGTAWTWPYPSYSEAYWMCYGEDGRETALAWLAGGLSGLEFGAAGHTPEILDGDAPHTPRGCDAQAWGVSELYRVWKKLGG